MREVASWELRRDWSHGRGGPDLHVREVAPGDRPVSALSDAQQEFAHDVALLILEAERLGLGVTFGEAWRNPTLQPYYVEAGLSWTLNSRHAERLAVDLNLFRAGEYLTDEREYQALGEFWEGLRPGLNQWGVGNATPRKDANHFERRRP